MLMHGMRSSKDFVAHLAASLRRRNSKDLILAPDYGYISIKSFLSPSYRRAKVAQFVDDYTQCFAVNSHARFYFAGHSNGTCILGEALHNVPGMCFARVYLAGS